MYKLFLNGSLLHPVLYCDILKDESRVFVLIFRCLTFFVILRSEATKNPVNFAKNLTGSFASLRMTKPFTMQNSLFGGGT